MTARLSLAEQLKRLEADDDVTPFGGGEVELDNLDGLSLEKKGEGAREHYLDVGPSRLRGANGAGQTLLGERYGGEVRGRMKIFDDDDDESDEDEPNAEGNDDEEEGENMAFGEVESDSAGFEDDDEDEEEEDDDEGAESDGDDDGDDDEEEAESTIPAPAASGSRSQVLDPMAALKDARAKDTEKGRAIKRQKKLFEDILTLRITLQKAWTASQNLPQEFPEGDPEGEVAIERQEALEKVGELSESLFELRSAMPPLPGQAPLESRKRKRPNSDDVRRKDYWEESARESLAMAEASRPAVNAILEKWSTKIQTASMQLSSKAAGSSKFLQGAKGQMGILDAIDTAVTAKREGEKSFAEHEDAFYRGLLREVIEARAGGGAGPDLTHLRREKKKKREEERGGSKGRKIRYTVHEKAQNFTVPIPLSRGWHEEQVDELFSSLFGGVGMSGASSEAAVAPDVGGGVEGLGGLRVF